LEDDRIKPHAPRLEIVIEFLAEPRRNLLQHFRGVDGGAHAGMDLEESGELDEVGFDRRLHVRILQLASKRASVMA
jgi:hypothetical protein